MDDNKVPDQLGDQLGLNPQEDQAALKTRVAALELENALLDAKIAALESMVAGFAAGSSLKIEGETKKKEVPAFRVFNVGGKKHQCTLHGFSPDGATVVHIADLTEKELAAAFKDFPGIATEIE